MKKIYLSIVMLIIVGLASCSDDDPDTPRVYPKVEIKLTAEQEAVNKDAQLFAWKLFSKIYDNKAEEGKNILISPLSFNYAFGMLQNGAVGETLDEISKALEFDGYKPDDINSFYQHLGKGLAEADRSIIFDNANSLWYRNTFTVMDDFIAVNKKYYDTEVKAEDFNDPKAVDRINQWCSDKTRGKIDKVIEKIDPEMMTYLINAIYFKGLWANQFSKKETKKDIFTLADKTTVEPLFMNREIEGAPYYEGDLFSYSALDFGNGAYQMFFILPNENIETEEVVNQLTADGLNFKTSSKTVKYALPKFETAYSIDLIPTLKDLGISKAFSTEADFSKLSQTDTYVGLVIQKSYLKIDEEGGEAAAVTVVGNLETALPVPTSVSFKLDHPFFYGIRETSTGTIMFLGHMANPIVE